MAERSRRVRAAEKALTARFGVPFRTGHDSGPRWELIWTDGPGTDTVKNALSTLDVTDVVFAIERRHSHRAIGLAALRHQADPTGRPQPRWQRRPEEIEYDLRDVDEPDRARDPREEAILDRLLTAAADGIRTGQRHAAIVKAAAGGLGQLLAGDLDGLDPIDRLSARYTRTVGGSASFDWDTKAIPLPDSAAVDALSDPDIDVPTARATLAVLARIRAAHTAREKAAMTAAARAGADWTQIGAALGVAQHWPPTTLLR